MNQTGGNGIPWNCTNTHQQRNMLLSKALLGVLWIFGSRTFAYDLSFVELIKDAVNVFFPPLRVSAYLCRLNHDDAIGLSKTMSRAGLAHDIHRDINGFKLTKHDTWDHKILYVLDLDCDHAMPLLRFANASGLFVAPIRWLLLQDLKVTGNLTMDIVETFRDMAVYPDSEVLVAKKHKSYGFTEIVSVYRPSPLGDVVVEDRGNWTAERGASTSNLHAASRRRRDLLGTPLKSCLVITDPDTINHLTDYENKHIDPVTKANYPWVLHIARRMNATISFDVINTWGYQEKNGSWSGMVGMLQRREIDIGGTAAFLIPQRIGVVDYVQLYTETRIGFVFRQPLLSTVSNIFTLPFQRSVWLAIGVFLALVLVVLYFSSKWEYRRGTSASNAEYWKQFNANEQTLSDNFMVVLGAVAHQGYSYEPYRVPSRITTLMLLIAALNLYASYTANIVALLQSPTNSIKTLADLLHSPLKLGAQDVVYSRHYFKSFQDPIRRAIVDQKIEPKGTNGSWMSIQEGVRRMRSELFAIHAEFGTAYDIVQETYHEDEKCGITEIYFLNAVFPLLVVQARSPYLEIIRSAVLLLRETGLKYRDEKRLYTGKPKCHGQTGYISIGLIECHFAFVSMVYGMLLSLALLALEFLWHKKGKAFVLSIIPFQSNATAWAEVGPSGDALNIEQRSITRQEIYS